MVKVPYALSGTRVGFPHTANRSEQWSCPECHAEVIVKRGDIKVPHFAHKASQSGCRGETFAHSSTKEWIAANVQSPDFRITSTCTGCCEPFTAFRGARGLAGATEVQIEAYRADAAAVECGRLVAAFEVLHSHKTGARKMATLLAPLCSPHSELQAAAARIDSLQACRRGVMGIMHAALAKGFGTSAVGSCGSAPRGTAMSRLGE